MIRLKYFFIFLSVFILLNSAFAYCQGHEEIKPGLSSEALEKSYPRSQARTYREANPNEQWLTFNDQAPNRAGHILTVHIKNGRVFETSIDARDEIIREYLGEFCSLSITQGFPHITQAIEEVLKKIPWTVFYTITDRQRPILFTEFYDSGTAQFANSSEIISLPNDSKAFDKGFTIIKLSTALEQSPDPQAIQGVVAHEIAHRYLDHSLKKIRGCKAEREANQTIREWGFDKAYALASKTFGHKSLGIEDPCRDNE